MRTLLKCFFTTTSMLLAANVASATTVDIDYENTTVRSVSSISSWNTRGVDMGGLTVEVFYGGTSSGQVAWGATGAADNVAGWSLSMINMSASTFNTQWLFDVTSGINVSKIVIEGGDNVVFDTWFLDKGIGTTGSAYGIKFTVGDVLYDHPSDVPDQGIINAGWSDFGTSELGTISIKYTNAVKLDSATNPVGDLFNTLTIVFDEDNYFNSLSQLAFYADTDNLRNPVPEPATMVLLGMGILGLVGRRTFRRQEL